MATLSPTHINIPRERHSSPHYNKSVRNTNISHYKKHNPYSPRNPYNSQSSSTHNAAYNYKCKHCNKHFEDRNIYAKHKSQQCQHRPLLHCPICPTSFRYVHWLDEHVQIEHQITPRRKANIKNYKRLSKYLTCQCGKEYDTYLLFNDHKTRCNYQEPLASSHDSKWYHHCSIS